MEQKTKQLVIIENVHGYVDENGTVWLNVEDVARGLGFSEPKGGIEYVKWSRVNRYLQEFGFSTQVSKDDFIPENIFYRLAMKAKNEVAQNFQAKVADEILPAIRKTGYYSVKHLTATQMFIAAARALEEQEQRITVVESGLCNVETNVSSLTESVADIRERLNHEERKVG